MELALFNNDHFGFTAQEVYKFGMRAALNAAVAHPPTEEGAMTHDNGGDIKRALAMCAFACHFLTDLYASGHLRTPRKKMAGEFGPIAGGLFSKCMHDEDNFNGLSVQSKEGRKYTVFGDSFLFEPSGAGFRTIAHEAIPDLAKAQNRDLALTKSASAPMFTVENGVLKMRVWEDESLITAPGPAETNHQDQVKYVPVSRQNNCGLDSSKMAPAFKALLPESIEQEGCTLLGALCVLGGIGTTRQDGATPYYPASAPSSSSRFSEEKKSFLRHNSGGA